MLWQAGPLSELPRSLEISTEDGRPIGRTIYLSDGGREHFAAYRCTGDRYRVILYDAAGKKVYDKMEEIPRIAQMRWDGHTQKVTSLIPELDEETPKSREKLEEKKQG